MSLTDLLDPPLEYVVSKYGVGLEREGDRLLGLCPFHIEDHPSFAIWRYGDREWCGCWSCGFGPTDVVGFIREIEHCDYARGIVISRRLAREVPSTWVSTTLKSTRSRDVIHNFLPELERAQKELANYHHEVTALNKLLITHNMRGAFDWIVREFGIGGDHKWIIVPHYTPSMQFVPAIKRREWDSILYTVGEGTLAFLYGCWRDRGQPNVVLAEGESDTWRLAWYLRFRPDWLVLGLPSGAKGPRPSWLEMLAESSLTLFFDADTAGDRARERWLEARPDAKAILLPDGLDACNLDDEALGGLL